MLNNCTFIGRLTKEVDFRKTPNGKSVANFTLAITREVPDQNGTRQTDFLDFVIWGKPAENMADQLSKGDMIAVVSKAQTRSYEGADGKKVYVTEFLVDGFPKYLRVKKWENGGNASGGNQNSGNSHSNDHDPFANAQPYDDDNLPF